MKFIGSEELNYTDAEVQQGARDGTLTKAIALPCCEPPQRMVLAAPSSTFWTGGALWEIVQDGFEGATLEIISLRSRMGLSTLMIVDEDGIYKDLHANDTASTILTLLNWEVVQVRGPAVLLYNIKDTRS